MTNFFEAQLAEGQAQIRKSALIITGILFVGTAA